MGDTFDALAKTVDAAKKEMQAITRIYEIPLPRRGLCLDYPLRSDFLAQIVVPLNMTQREAERLSAFLMTLAQEG